MKVGSLVKLDSDMFYDHDEMYGIVIKILEEVATTNPWEHMVLVAWSDGEINKLYISELEVISEGGESGEEEKPMD